MEQIRWVFDDNWRIIFVSFPYVVVTQNRPGKAILMSTYNLCFYGELSKIIPKLSLSYLFICSTETEIISGVPVFFLIFMVSVHVFKSLCQKQWNR